MMKITVIIPITSSSVNSISITSPLGKAKKKFSLPDKGEATATVLVFSEYPKILR